MRSNETLELKQVREQGGLYGIGLKIDTDPPHMIQRVSDLRDPDDNVLEDLRVGDCLLMIDGKHVEFGSMEALEQAILGPKDSTLTLTFGPRQGSNGTTSGGIREIVVKRHVPIREWDEKHCWLELRDEAKGRPLLADEGIVCELEALRRCVADRSNCALDLISEERISMSSVGILFAQDMLSNECEAQSMRPNYIHMLVPGSPAHSCGMLQEGDEIIAVDDVPPSAEAGKITKLLRGSDAIGSRCKVTVKRGTRSFDVELTRTSAFSVRNMVCFKDLCGILERQIKQRADFETMMPSLQAIFAHAIETERARCCAEASLAGRLFRLQSKIVGLINGAEGMLHSPHQGSQGELARLQSVLETLEEKLHAAATERDHWKAKHHVLREERETLQLKMSKSDEANQDLRRKLEGMLPPSERAVLVDKISHLQNQVSELRRTNKGMVLKEMLNEEMNRANMNELEARRLQAAIHNMVPRHQFEDVQARSTRLEVEVETLQSKLRMSVSREEYGALEVEADRIRQGSNLLLAKLEDMTDRDALDKAVTDLQKAREELVRQSLTIKSMVPVDELHEAKRESKEGWDKFESLGVEMACMALQVEDLEAKLLDSVPKAVLLAAQTDARVMTSTRVCMFVPVKL
jgi:hypothetical protein